MFYEKPYAPKPIKRYSNNMGLKVNDGFDKEIKLDNHTISSVKFERKINLENPFSPVISPIGSNKILEEEDELSLFINELKMNKSEESAKIEIFSILNRNDSTFYASLNGRSDSTEGDDNRLPINNEEEENLKFTFPPLRSFNPFYKNINYNSSDEQEIDLNAINFKSKIFCKSKKNEN